MGFNCLDAAGERATHEERRADVLEDQVVDAVRRRPAYRVESADEVQLGVGQLGARHRVPQQDENSRLPSHQCPYAP